MIDTPPRIVLDTNVLYADDMVLELAVAAQVPCIVSFNAKDFRPASRFGIEVITPKTVLEQLENRQ